MISVWDRGFLALAPGPARRNLSAIYVMGKADGASVAPPFSGCGFWPTGQCQGVVGTGPSSTARGVS